MTTDHLGDRMKRYESVSQSHLMKRTPVIIRLDGKAFHTFTKSIKSNGDLPFNRRLHDAMLFTSHALLENIQGAVLAYTQSDEISILLQDWETLETQAWYDYNVQKLTSVSASIAATAFNHFYFYLDPRGEHCSTLPFAKLAQFDSRAYNVPKEEVVNYYIWRQQDAIRNSIQMTGHHKFSTNTMHGKANKQVLEMLKNTGVDWDTVDTWMKHGSCVYRGSPDHQPGIFTDTNIPVFVGDRGYIQRHLPHYTP